MGSQTNIMLVTQHPASAVDGCLVLGLSGDRFFAIIGHSTDGFGLGCQTGTLDWNAFSDLAVARSGDTFTPYKNGVSVASGTSSMTWLNEPTRNGAIRGVPRRRRQLLQKKDL